MKKKELETFQQLQPGAVFEDWSQPVLLLHLKNPDDKLKIFCKKNFLTKQTKWKIHTETTLFLMR